MTIQAGESSKPITAIVIVDMQPELLGDECQHLPGKISDFLAAVQLEHRIFTRQIALPVPSAETPLAQTAEVSHSLGEMGIASQLAAYPTKIIDKASHSPFANPQLEQYLNGLCLTSTYVCGIDTNLGITQLAGGLFDRRIRPVVISDLCASTSGPVYHQEAMGNLVKWIGKDNIITTDKLTGK